MAIIAPAVAILAGAINWQIQFFVTGLVFFLSGVLYQPFFKTRQIKIAFYSIIVLTPFFLIFTLYALINSKPHGYPTSIIQMVSYPIGLWVSGYVARRPGIFLITLFCLFLGLFSYYAIPNYTSYVMNKNSMPKAIPQDIRLVDRAGNTFSISELKGKVIVLDFWNSTCSVCFKKFPEFDILYETYRTRKDIVFYAVNLKIKELDIHEIWLQSDKIQYDFPLAFTDDENSVRLIKELEIQGVPTFIIIDRDFNIKYSGELITENNVFMHNAFGEINKVLESK
jgi:thiol-disulfide isomerase/thioredoxin